MAAQHDRLPTPEGRRIIVGVDGSAMSLARVEIAAALPLAIALVGRAGSQATTTIGRGDPKREILGAASDVGADLIVLGSRGLGGFKGLLLGSVSRGVAKAAPCSLLVVASPRLGTRRAGPSEAPSSRMTRGEEVPQ